MKKTILALVVGAIVILVFIAVVGRQWNPAIKSNKISVVTTLFPLYDFAKYIGGEKADVSLLLPPGVEPHSFEPRPSDIEKINRADVFIYTGKFMEPWAEDILRGVENKDLIVVNASTGITLTQSAGSMDPHIWLDFDNDKIIVGNISKALADADPENANYYKNNAGEDIKSLSAMDERFRKNLSRCKISEIIYGGHYAFGYLAKRYGLKYVAAQGVSPDSEPTAKDLINLVDQIKKNDIKYVFYEELSSPKIAETIANETSAQMLFLNAAHNVGKNNISNLVSFFTIMEGNLRNLLTGLECKK